MATTKNMPHKWLREVTNFIQKWTQNHKIFKFQNLIKNYRIVTKISNQLFRHQGKNTFNLIYDTKKSIWGPSPLLLIAHISTEVLYYIDNYLGQILKCLVSLVLADVKMISPSKDSHLVNKKPEPELSSYKYKTQEFLSKRNNSYLKSSERTYPQ